MNNTIKSVLDGLASVYEVTDEVLNGYTGTAKLQVPVLMQMLAIRLNWDASQVRRMDPLVRHYITNNPDWHISRGAHGGIERASDKQKKEAERLAKASLKAQIKAEIEAKLAQAQNTIVAA